MIIIIFVIAFVVLVFRYLLKALNQKLLFHPTKSNETVDHQKITDFYTKYGMDITAKSGYIGKVHYIYLLNNKSNDMVTLLAHGNAGNILYRYQSSNVIYSLKYGSVLLYDYRGYGKSGGYSSEENIYKDTYSAWKYLKNTLNYRPNQIILYGESLGCSAISWLANYLINDTEYKPRKIILQSGFYSLERRVMDISSYLWYLLTENFNNFENRKQISKKCDKNDVIILHSKRDEVIDYSHSVDLAGETGFCFIEIGGTHNNPIFNSNVDDQMLK